MLNLNWSEAKTGFMVDCMVMGDDYDTITDIRYSFTLAEYEKVLKFIAIIDTSESKSFNEIQKIIIMQSNTDKETLKQWLDELEEESYYSNEKIVGYRVIKIDNSGISYAMFNGKPYNNITNQAEDFFDIWSDTIN